MSSSALPTYIVTCTYTTHFHAHSVAIYEGKKEKGGSGGRKGTRGRKRRDYSWSLVSLERGKTIAKLKTHD